MEFVEAAKRMEPLDARVLEALGAHADYSPNARDSLAPSLKVSSDEVEVAFYNLEALGLTLEPRRGSGLSSGMPAERTAIINPKPTARGRELLRALRD